MEINDLAMTVLVTRPYPQGVKLCELIESAGGQAIHFPTIVIKEPPDLNRFHYSIQSLNIQDWAIFISPQAVYSSINEIRRLCFKLPKIAAVGTGTAQTLEKAGLKVDCYPLKESGGEGLVKLPEFANCKGTKIAIIRGVGGRQWLDAKLASLGAKVTTIIAYERTLPQVDVSSLQLSLSQNKIHAISGTSFEAIHNLKIIIGPNYWNKLRKLPVYVYSERIKKLAIQLGFATIWVTDEMSDTSLLQMLRKHKGT